MEYNHHSWIFQGNPLYFDIDRYISTHTYLYWYCPRHKNQIELGDQVFLWRARKNIGLVAIGKIVEKPVNITNVRFPDLLGQHLWYQQQDIEDSTNTKVGIEIQEVRITQSDGMIERNTLKEIPNIKDHRIITNPVGTVFSIQENLKDVLLNIWTMNSSEELTDIYHQQVLSQESLSILEGRTHLVIHKRRERSPLLRREKIKRFKEQNNNLYCELCKFSFNESYPVDLSQDYIEVHHLKPLANSNMREPTKLEDLMLVCSNCHRMIHRTKDYDNNLNKLREWFLNL